VTEHSQSQKVSVSLSAEWLRFAEEYQKTHGLSSRSEVIQLALKKLREWELAEGYRQMARDYAEHPDPLLDLEFDETVEQIDRG
jgi:Arc/MetJ-type ribon-helix-helix transcriptional regulator